MSMDLPGIALVIGAVGSPIAIVMVARMQMKVVKTVETKVDTVTMTAEETLRQTALVNHAVNGKDPRDSTLSEDVITIRDKQESDASSQGPKDALIPMVAKLSADLDEIKKRLSP